MFSLGSSHRYYLYNGDCDMRKSFSSLSGLVYTQMNRDPLNGDVYIFINKRSTQMKLLHWEAGGFVIYYKRLEQGTFDRLDTGGKQAQGTTAISWSSLVLLLEGIQVKSMVQRQRFRKEKYQEMSRKKVIKKASKSAFK